MPGQVGPCSGGDDLPLRGGHPTNSEGSSKRHRMEEQICSSGLGLNTYFARKFHSRGHVYLRAAAPAADPGRPERIPKANPA